MSVPLAMRSIVAVRDGGTPLLIQVFFAYFALNTKNWKESMLEK